MIENESETKGTISDKARGALTLALGMLVVLWRVILPTNVEITTGIVIMVAVLDLVLTATLILINKNELRKVFARRFSGKDILKTIVCFIIFFAFVTVSGIGLQLVLGVLEIEIIGSPAAWVAQQFFVIFPIGVFISTVIAAPIWEEIVFRMAGKHLIKNKFLFVVITTFLFVFIHTGPLYLDRGLFYAFAGIGYAIIYLITKDIRIAIGVHFLNNLLAAIMILLG